MNRRDRLLAAVAGGPLDRVPVSAWGHFFDKETSAEGLADAMLGFQAAYDWDFIKIHSRASYPAEGFGLTWRPSGRPGRNHECTGRPIATAADYRRLRPLTMSTDALKEQLDAIRLIRRGAAADVPLIMTVFSPLDVADKLVNRDQGVLARHLEDDPDAVRAGLDVITETFAAFVRALARSGVDGIYFATKWANGGRLPVERYRALARPLDLALLAEARSMPCNMLHLCEDRIHLQAMADYPVQVVHWDADAAHNPAFAEGRRLCRTALGGGVDAPTLAHGTAAEVAARARAAVAAAGGRRFVLGPGCSVDIARTPRENLLALRDAARGTA